jgi:hypothetical protein
MNRSYLLRRPKDDDDNDNCKREVIKAKPIDPHLARNIGYSNYNNGKDFVRASENSQKQFYGTQTILNDNETTTSSSSYREMTHDERNKLNASIIKAELKGDMVCN